MADPVSLTAGVETAVKSIPGISVFDGYVPTKVPEAGGFILPYVVLWAGVGDNPEEQASCGQHNTDTLIWDFQTTIVAATPDLCRRVAADVKNRLTNRAAGTGVIRPNPDGFQQQQPILDTGVTPARFMLPIPWRLITN